MGRPAGMLCPRLAKRYKMHGLFVPDTERVVNVMVMLSPDQKSGIGIMVVVCPRLRTRYKTNGFVVPGLENDVNVEGFLSLD